MEEKSGVGIKKGGDGKAGREGKAGVGGRGKGEVRKLRAIKKKVEDKLKLKEPSERTVQIIIHANGSREWVEHV